MKKRKKIFFGQIGLEFSARHGQPVSSRILRVASVKRKSIFAYERYFQRKVFWREHYGIRSERQKRTFLYVPESSEFYPRRNQWVNLSINYILI